MTSRRTILKAAGLALFTNPLVATSEAQVAEVASPRAKHLSTRYGLNLHIDRFGHEAAFLQLAEAKAAGVQGIRGLSASLSQIQPRPGEWSFTKTDRDLALLEQFGFEAIGLLGYGVAWASALDSKHNQEPMGQSFFPPDDLNVWAEYVQRVVERYHEKVRVWAPWNEPDNFGFFMPVSATDAADPTLMVRRREKFMELQQLTFAVVKRLDPDAIVLSGGFAMGGQFDKAFLPWVIEHGLMDCCDALDLHSYWGIKFLESTVVGARSLMEKAGKLKPIWVTEFGAAIRKDQSWIGTFGLDQIASLAVKAVVTAAALELESLYWYEGFTNSPAPTAIGDAGYSLSVTDGPTPAYWAFANAVQLLQGTRYVGPVAITGGRAKGYQFSAGKRELIFMWALSPDGLDNRSSTTKCQFNWRGRDFAIALSDRPTVLSAI